MINTVILDLDGPLLDGIQRHYQCYSDILIQCGVVPVPRQQYWEMKRNRTDRRKLLALSDAVAMYDEFMSAWVLRIETKEYLMLDRLQNNVLKILNDWKNSGIRLLIATMRNNSANTDWQLARLGILPLVDTVVVVGTEQGGAKKAAEIKPLLKESDLNGTIWIGDTEVDIHAARELGVRVCALTCGLRTAEYLASLSPDRLEADLYSFAKSVCNKS